MLIDDFSGSEFLEEQARAFNDIILVTLQCCDEQESSSRALGAEGETVYDELAGQLYYPLPLPFNFPLPSAESPAANSPSWTWSPPRPVTCTLKPAG